MTDYRLQRTPRVDRSSPSAEAGDIEAPSCFWEDVLDLTTEAGQIDFELSMVLFKESLRRLWLTSDEIARRSGLSRGQVQEFLSRYAPMGLVAAHPSRPDCWADGEAVAHRAALSSPRSQGSGS